MVYVFPPSSLSTFTILSRKISAQNKIKMFFRSVLLSLLPFVQSSVVKKQKKNASAGGLRGGVVELPDRLAEECMTVLNAEGVKGLEEALGRDVAVKICPFLVAKMDAAKLKTDKFTSSFTVQPVEGKGNGVIASQLIDCQELPMTYLSNQGVMDLYHFLGNTNDSHAPDWKALYDCDGDINCMSSVWSDYRGKSRASGNLDVRYKAEDYEKMATTNLRAARPVGVVVTQEIQPGEEIARVYDFEWLGIKYAELAKGSFKKSTKFLVFDTSSFDMTHELKDEAPITELNARLEGTNSVVLAKEEVITLLDNLTRLFIHLIQNSGSFKHRAIGKMTFQHNLQSSIEKASEPIHRSAAEGHLKQILSLDCKAGLI